MKDYRTIVVPVDGSDNSKRAVEHAVTIASTVGASLTLVYVANIVSVISKGPSKGCLWGPSAVLLLLMRHALS